MPNAWSRILAIAFLISILPAGAEAVAFPDVPERHPSFEAIDDLRIRGLIQGYPDGTFKPTQSVNRAEALKLIVAPISFDEHIASFEQSSYEDVPNTIWFFPYAERAFQIFGIIDGPPKTTNFHPERTVNKAEFLKMILLANGVNINDFDNVKLPLSDDVINHDEWYYPYLRYAMTASMIDVGDDSTLEPGKELTRADVAEILYALLQYKEDERTQILIDRTEAGLLTTLQNINKDLESASYSSARAMLMAYGAHRNRPDDPLLKGLVKMAEGFRSLVVAEENEREGEWAQVEEAAQNAWNLAEEADEFHSDFRSIAGELRRLAREKVMRARDAR